MALIWTASLPPLSLMAVGAHCGLGNMAVLAEKKSRCLQENIQDSDYRSDVPLTLLLPLLLCCCRCRCRRRCCDLLSACVQVLGLLWRVRQQCSWLCAGLPPVL